MVTLLFSDGCKGFTQLIQSRIIKMCTLCICLLHNNMHCQTFGVLSLLLYGNRQELHLVPSSPVGMVKTPFTLSSYIYLKN